MNRIRLHRILSLVVIGITLLLVGADADPKEDKSKTFMKQKLEHAQKILEGLTQEKYDVIEKNANSLNALSQAAFWHALQTPQYTQYSGEFQRLTDKLAKSASEKNIDAATLTYVEITLNCVNCHKHVRNQRQAALEFPLLR